MLPETITREESLDPPYTDTWDHLRDELALLDLMIRLKVLQQWKAQPSTPLDQFKGLIIAESEVAALLAGLSARSNERTAPPTDDSEESELKEAIRNLGSSIEARRRASVEAGVVLALDRIGELFQLTSFEQRCLVICLAVELDRCYEKLYAYLQDDVTRKKPTIDLALNLLAANDSEKLAARHSFSSVSPLTRYQLIHLSDHYPDGKAPLLLRSLKLDDRIADYLLGVYQTDSRLEGIARSIAPNPREAERIIDPEPQSRLERVVDRCFNQSLETRRSLVVYLHGPAGTGKRALVEQVASSHGLPVLIVDAQRMLESATPFDELARLSGREAILTPAVLCFENLDLLPSDERGAAKLERLIAISAEVAWLVFLLGKKPWRPGALPDTCSFFDLSIGLPDDGQRRHLWEIFARSGFDVEEGTDFGTLASRFRLSSGQIREALATAEISAQSSSSHGSITTHDLTAACRSLSSQRLATLAKKIEPHYRWDDIVLPDDVIAQLREVCSRVVHRHRVLGEWGFARKLSLGKGVNALFAGPSGTGKTMASEIIANELELDLYKIDLSGVISKYIGETEKNLDRVFSAAEDANAILFFDEADALFGKRSEVRDSHDRYANIEISYLLQKMEEYEGLAILATNLRGNLDESFTRRLAFTIHFPFPDELSRLRIWRGIWPADLELDERADLDFLARRFKLSGGNIKNIALAAAFLAAEEGSPRVAMRHLIHATQREFQKLGKPLTDTELGPHTPEAI
jgi:SpoVK/Ycf46/Vps4 family AAA+-type ATPase